MDTITAEENLNNYVREMVQICGVDFLYHVLFHGISCEETHDFLTPEQKIELDKRYQAAYKEVSKHLVGVELDCQFTELTDAVD
jgi:hypothetical protein